MAVSQLDLWLSVLPMVVSFCFLNTPSYQLWSSCLPSRNPNLTAVGGVLQAMAGLVTKLISPRVPSNRPKSTLLTIGIFLLVWKGIDHDDIGFQSWVNTLPDSKKNSTGPHFVALLPQTSPLNQAIWLNAGYVIIILL